MPLFANRWSACKSLPTIRTFPLNSFYFFSLSKILGLIISDSRLNVACLVWTKVQSNKAIKCVSKTVINIFLNFYVLGAFNIMYKHQDFFYDCHFLYSFLLPPATSFFPHTFYDSTWCFSQRKLLCCRFTVFVFFLHDKSHKRVSETLTVSGRRQKGENKGRKSNCVTRYACLLPNTDCCCFFALNTQWNLKFRLL